MLARSVNTTSPDRALAPHHPSISASRQPSMDSEKQIDQTAQAGATTTTHSVRHSIYLMEVIVSIALLAVVMTGTFSGIHANRSFRRKLTRRAQATLVLDNTLERASALGSPSLSQVQAILSEETRAAGLDHILGLLATCETESSTVDVVIRVGNKPPLAQMRMDLK